MKEETYLSLGVMSGTSLDGLDLALCQFNRNGDHWAHQILKATTISYTNTWKNKLLAVENSSALSYIKTDWELGHYIGKKINDFLKDEKATLDCIASHGHTIFHQPGRETGFTAQIGNGSAIAAQTNITVINDFRIADVALGGQGAPLVPIGDQMLFADYQLCLNLGGIANISAVVQETRKAYDICACNMALNHIAALAGLVFDESGKLAATGSLKTNLLQELDQLPFFSITGPKSLGKEWFLAEVLPILQKHKYSPADLAHTFVKHITKQISITCNHMQKEFDHNPKMLVTGGGAYHSFLISCLKETLPWLTIEVPKPQLLEFKEALIFAFLGVLRLLKIPNCLASVTGASKNNIGGVVHVVP